MRIERTVLLNMFAAKGPSVTFAARTELQSHAGIEQDDFWGQWYLAGLAERGEG